MNVGLNHLGLTRGDWLTTAFALVLLAILYWAFWRLGGQGAEVRVLVDGRPWARLSLFQNQDLYVPGKLGTSHIQVHDGQVRFVDSPCTTHQCVQQGWLSEGGESAACLPNGVSLLIPADDGRFDTLNF
jgi:hypothetical protein